MPRPVSKQTKTLPARAKQQQHSFEISVPPSDRIFAELGNTTYDLLDAVSELIDNSIAAAPKKGPYNITLIFSHAKTAAKESFQIVDDCEGIPRDKLGEAVSPACTSGSGLNEHGLGMKQAVASIGLLKKLITKSQADVYGIQIEKFSWTLKAKEIRTAKAGTTILVSDLKRRVITGTEKQKIFAAELGARYRRFLDEHDRLKLVVQFDDVETKRSIFYEVDSVRPVYFNPNTRKNTPTHDREFKGTGWKARIRIGFAPDSESEYQELKLHSPDRGMPYSITSRNAGIDLIRFDRVIRFHVLEPYFTDTRHGQYNLVRGELELLHGFTTAITKNAITADNNFEECISRIREYILSEEILAKRPSSGYIPENVLRDRLAVALKRPPHNKQDVHKEVAVGVLDGHIDILADEEPYELKAGDATGLDVYQLFAYMDMRGYTKGYLVAQTFKPTVEPVLKHIKDKHKIIIEAVNLSSYGITQILSEAEANKGRANRKKPN